MPIYDYRCDACGQVYDIFHKVREVEDDIVCPQCQSTKHTRLLSAPQVAIKSGQTVDFAPCGQPRGSCGKACDALD